MCCVSAKNGQDGLRSQFFLAHRDEADFASDCTVEQEIRDVSGQRSVASIVRFPV